MPIKEIIEIILNIFRENPFKVLSRKKIVIGVVLLLGLALLLYQSLINQEILKLRAMRLQSRSLKKLLLYKQIIIKDPSILLEKIKNMESRFSLVKSRFIIEEDLPKFFDSLRDSINKTDNQLLSLELKSLTPIKDWVLSGKDSMAYYQRLPFTVSVKADYVSALLLLNKIENEPYLIEINNINMAANKNKPSEILMNLDLNLYVLRE